jgi:3-oxoacyl-ACP reductase-like protein
MGIFSNIVSAIFGNPAAAALTPARASPAAASPTAAAAAASPTAATAAASPTAAAQSSAGSAAKPMSRDELNAMIGKIAAQQKEDLNWKESIVDLMKLLKLDSSLAARKQLAQELGYTGALDGSAAMNVWLHKQVMTKVAEGGGTVPDSLKHA